LQILHLHIFGCVQVNKPDLRENQIRLVCPWTFSFFFRIVEMGIEFFCPYHK